MYVVFLKITTFLWRTLILYPSHTNLYLEIVMIKFGRPRGQGSTYGAEGQGPRKTNTQKITESVKLRDQDILTSSGGLVPAFLL